MSAFVVYVQTACPFPVRISHYCKVIVDSCDVKQQMTEDDGDSLAWHPDICDLGLAIQDQPDTKEACRVLGLNGNHR